MTKQNSLQFAQALAERYIQLKQQSHDDQEALQNLNNLEDAIKSFPYDLETLVREEIKRLEE
ncbi:5-bromo-4-chloroindolyl phosphate hydrolysis protein [Fontibacillus solani]|uniref:5-bromo-4-chloroindolyl phosphate hydrolysis protein n=1 Tax=Fontibacillus solani TaxID=1572857 RepID=A0A7W3SUP9_9BACL|nr:hypothetical protein [Fontibacillus solani]MBA9086542.1 5-bromo-4-chloroindolyl phosphate hydrolysis protein [Fontibacillus solani]